MAKKMLITKEENDERRWCLEQSMKRIQMVMSPKEVSRIRISRSVMGDEMVVDLHEMATNEAITFINNIVNLSKGQCAIKLVHGYTHGEALKDMVRGRFYNNKIVGKYSSSKNLGATILYVSDLQGANATR